MQSKSTDSPTPSKRGGTITTWLIAQVRRFVHVACHGSESQQRRVLMAWSVLSLLTVFALEYGVPHETSGDSLSYIEAGENFANGTMDMFRTPIYPYLCAAGKAIGGEAGRDYLLMILQMAAFLATVPLLLRTCILLNAEGKPVVRFIVTALYGCNLAVPSWTMLILTESLSISAVVVLLYLIVKLTRRDTRARVAIGAPLYWLAMVMLKPFFICFLPVVVIALVVWCYRCKASMRSIAGIALSMTIAAGAYLGYCKEYEKHYGVFTTNCIGIQNFSKQLEIAGLMENPCYGKDFYNPAEESSRHKEAFEANPKAWLRQALKETGQSLNDPIPWCSLPENGITAQALLIRFPAAMWLMMLMLFIATHLFRLWRYRSDVMIHALLAIMALAAMFTAVWGSAFDSYYRLFLPAYPILCLLLAAPCRKG